METRHGMPITVTGSDKLAGANFTIEKGAAPMLPQRRVERTAVNMDWGFDEGADLGEGESQEAPAPRQSARDFEAGGEEGQSDGRRRRRRRRRGGRRGDRPEGESYGHHGHNGQEAPEIETSEDGVALSAGDGDEPAEFGDEPRETARTGGEERTGQRSRRRGRRGGRRGRERRAGGSEGAPGAGEQPDIGPERAHEGEADFAPRSEHEPSPAPERTERPARRAPAPEPAFAGEDTYGASHTEVMAQPVAEAAAPAPETQDIAPKRARHRAGASEPRIERIVVGEAGQAEAAGDEPAEGSSAPARKGWWQRRLGGE
jgi:ribonuclease E